MVMGTIQIGVVVCAALVRWTSAGWFLILGVVFTAGLLPAIVLGPLIFAGFLASSTMWPLFAAADLFLIVTALTVADGGDNGPLVPILDKNNPDPRTVDRVDRIGKLSGVAYLVTLVVLLSAIVGA